MALRRGFKSEAERIAKQVRADLGLNGTQSVTPVMLAKLLGIEIWSGDELIPRERFVELDQIQHGAFSACTLRPSDDRIAVVYNPLSSRSRQTSDLAHELAHILLNHKLSQIVRLGDITFLSCDQFKRKRPPGYLDVFFYHVRCFLRKSAEGQMRRILQENMTSAREWHTID